MLAKTWKICSNVSHRATRRDRARVARGPSTRHSDATTLTRMNFSLDMGTGVCTCGPAAWRTVGEVDGSTLGTCARDPRSGTADKV